MFCFHITWLNDFQSLDIDPAEDTDRREHDEGDVCQQYWRSGQFPARQEQRKMS